MEVEKSNESDEYPCVVDRRTGKVYGGEKGVIVEIQGKGMVRIIKEIGLVPLEESVIYPGDRHSHGVRFIPELKP